MASPERLADDVRYVRSLLRTQSPMPVVVALLWAAIGAAGFALMDFAPAAVPWYWTAAAPLGLGLSSWLGYRQSARTGEVDAAGPRWVWHWLTFLGGVGLAVLTAAMGWLPWAGLNVLIPILLAVTYTLAGVHLDRRLLWVGAAFALVVPLAAGMPRFGWSTAGAVVALALIVVIAAGRRRPGV